MKYRIKYHDTTWLFFTPLAFLNMGGTDLWTVESKKHWWNSWKVIGRYSNQAEAYADYFKKAYDLEIKTTMWFPHNRIKDKKTLCELCFQCNPHSPSPEYTYMVGYKPPRYARFYYTCYSSKSYEDALHKLYWDLYIKKLIEKKNDEE